VTPPVVYLDTCSINRLTDHLGQPRLLAEAQAMTSIFTLIHAKQIRWIASTLLRLEISRNPDPDKRVFAQSLLPPRGQTISPAGSTLSRAAELQHEGLNSADALHVALAEQARAEWFITTDDRILRRMAKRTYTPECINPVDWLRRRQLWLVPNP
jgi:predicted nucleic acid-binding protein